MEDNTSIFVVHKDQGNISPHPLPQKNMDIQGESQEVGDRRQIYLLIIAVECLNIIFEKLHHFPPKLETTQLHIYYG